MYVRSRNLMYQPSTMKSSRSTNASSAFYPSPGADPNSSSSMASQSSTVSFLLRRGTLRDLRMRGYGNRRRVSRLPVKDDENSSPPPLLRSSLDLHSSEGGSSSSPSDFVSSIKASEIRMHLRIIPTMSHGTSGAFVPSIKTDTAPSWMSLLSIEITSSLPFEPTTATLNSRNSA